MELEVKDWYTSDVDDWENWNPKKIDDIYFPLDVYIGEKGSKGADIFSILVATPESLRKYDIEIHGNDIVFMRHYLLISKYNWKEIEGSIEKLIQDCQRDTWDESVEKLCRYFHWEYEDYKVYD